jgi:hypothetical protein
VAAEAWYTRAVEAAGAPGDVRLVMHLDTLVRTPHFRSYWIQGNVTELSQYASGVSDLTRIPGAIQEARVLLRAEEQTAPADQEAIARMVRLVPDAAGLYRAWASPPAEQAVALLMQEILAPGPGATVRDEAAPRVALTDGTVGSARDLETRIDEAILGPEAAAYDVATLTRLAVGAPLRAVLHLEATRDAAGGVFVERGSVVVIERADAWPAGAAAEALRRVVEPVWSRGGAPLRWTAAGTGAEPFVRLEGIERLAVAERGTLLFVANDAALLSAALSSVARPVADVQGTYAAGFRHSLERDRFTRLMRFVDHAAGLRDGFQPPFFSGNLASLSQTLAQVDEASIVVRDRGDRVTETVVYALAP